MEGWSDSIMRTRTVIIHYYKDGISLCKRSKTDLGNKHFDRSEKDASDAYSYHCKICIKKQIMQNETKNKTAEYPFIEHAKWFSENCKTLKKNETHTISNDMYPIRICRMDSDTPSRVGLKTGIIEVNEDHIDKASSDEIFVWVIWAFARTLIEMEQKIVGDMEPFIATDNLTLKIISESKYPVSCITMINSFSGILSKKGFHTARMKNYVKALKAYDQYTFIKIKTIRHEKNKS